MATFVFVYLPTVTLLILSAGSLMIRRTKEVLVPSDSVKPSLDPRIAVSAWGSSIERFSNFTSPKDKAISDPFTSRMGFPPEIASTQATYVETIFIFAIGNRFLIERSKFVSSKSFTFNNVSSI